MLPETAPIPPALWSDSSLFRAAFREGLARAAASLSAMIGAEIEAVDQRVEMLPLNEAMIVAGRPDEPKLGVYLGVTGQINAHIVLLFTPHDAERLVDLLLGQVGTDAEREELTVSALGEVGNVMGSSFAIALGDLIGSPLWSTPPTVQMDMARALVDGLLACASAERDEVLVVVTQFGQRDAAEARPPVRGTFLVVPEIEGLAALFGALARPG